MLSLVNLVASLRYLIVGSYQALSGIVSYVYALNPRVQNGLSQSSSTTTSRDPETNTKNRSTVMATSNLAMGEGLEIKVTKLLVHPIKSCRGISLSESNVTSEGLLYDRQYVIVDAASHKFITAREIPKLVLIETAIEAGETPLLLVSFPPESGIPSFKTCLTPSSETLDDWELISDLEIWHDKDLDAYVAQSSSSDSTASPSEILSSYLDREVLLVLKGPKRRAACPTASHPDLDVGYRFQDEFPLLIATTESLAAVQEKVRLSAAGAEGWKVGGITSQWENDELVIERFRPNIVLSGSPAPFDEDYWGDIQIGEESSRSLVLSLVGRCGRCLLPNTNPTTGVRDKAVPFKVISKFRKVEPKKTPCFGVTAVVQSSGILKVGDSVKVLNVLERETFEAQASG
ncbi:MOSC N-terminal beta barrel domain-containing protein [Rhizoctonia solani]|nr:MOSC N-terminal beta barrel domain-containing protein [Rhizoctonia solani]